MAIQWVRWPISRLTSRVPWILTAPGRGRVSFVSVMPLTSRSRWAMSDLGQGLSLMVVGMGVVFLVLILLALATGLLEMLFRPSVEREPDLPSQASTETRNESTRRTVALVAVGLYLE